LEASLIDFLNAFFGEYRADAAALLASMLLGDSAEAMDLILLEELSNALGLWGGLEASLIDFLNVFLGDDRLDAAALFASILLGDSAEALDLVLLDELNDALGLWGGFLPHGCDALLDLRDSSLTTGPVLSTSTLVFESAPEPRTVASISDFSFNLACCIVAVLAPNKDLDLRCFKGALLLGEPILEGALVPTPSMS
jgi:hypothetical protein